MLVTNGDNEDSNLSYIGLGILFQCFSSCRGSITINTSLRGVDILLLNEKRYMRFLELNKMETRYMSQRVG